jgi:hypothetical protein
VQVPFFTSLSIHAPERFEGESFSAYKQRRAASRKAAREAMGHGLNGGTSSRKQYRDSMRASGTMGKKTRAYVALMAAWASKRVPKWEGPRDEHGAYTLVGSVYEMEGEDLQPTSREHLFGGSVANGGHTQYTARRIWLAGVSAQRGY